MMLKQIFDFFKRNEEKTWSEKDQTACLKLMMLLMYADNRLSADEETLIEQKLQDFNWINDNNRNIVLNKIVDDVRNLRDQRGRELFIRQCVEDISCKSVQSDILKLCQELVQIDGDAALNEIEIIHTLQKYLDLNK